MKTVLITGAASGIGEAAARRLSATTRVILSDRDGRRAEEIGRELRDGGRDCHAVAMDVTEPASVTEGFRHVRDRYGPVDGLFANAGQFLTGAVADLRLETWDAMVATHLTGTFRCCQAVLPDMVARRKGAVVVMASDYAVKGMAGGAAYAAVKTALFSLAKSLALEFAPFGIRVNAVGPGPIATPLLRGALTDDGWERFREARAAQVPMGRLGSPDEVASVVAFLLSDASAYMTGQIVHPNGGQLSW